MRAKKVNFYHTYFFPRAIIPYNTAQTIIKAQPKNVVTEIHRKNGSKAGLKYRRHEILNRIKVAFSLKPQL